MSAESKPENSILHALGYRYQAPTSPTSSAALFRCMNLRKVDNYNQAVVDYDEASTLFTQECRVNGVDELIVDMIKRTSFGAYTLCRVDIPA